VPSPELPRKDRRLTVFMEQQLRRRRRPALSCFECRRRKIKCDRNDPCAHCSSTKTQCVYKVWSKDSVNYQRPEYGNPSDSTSRPLYESSTLDPFQYTSTNISTPPHDNHPSGQQVVAGSAIRPTENPNFLNRYHVQLSSRTQDTEPDVRNLLQRLQKLEASSAADSTFKLVETGSDKIARLCGLQNSPIILNKTRILRWSHWLGTGQEVYTALI
jgi:hypothetical protein